MLYRLYLGKLRVQLRVDMVVYLCLAAVIRKRPESVSNQKKDGHAWPRPSFCWYDTDFLFFFLAIFFYFILYYFIFFIFFFFSKSLCRTKRRLSAAMRTH